MTHMLNRPAVLVLACLALTAPGLAPTAALAQPIFATRAACLDKVEEAPDFALADAQAWERQGGGADARLCQALARLATGDWEAAAQGLEALLPELAGEPADVRANLWTRTGLAWSRAGQPQRADAAHGRAIALAPRDPQMHLDRALARAGQERWWDAITDLDRALDLAPDHLEARLLRADAQARLGRGREAMMDVDAVLTADSANPDALLLRGELLADREDFTAARADWQRVLTLAPDSPAADQARRNLRALDEMAKRR